MNGTLSEKISHFFLGCREFNHRYPHWVKTDGKYPECSICGHKCYWMWGWKRQRPDLVAQRVQGTEPDEGTRFWAEHDGWM